MLELSLSIQELAKIMQVSTRTLRFYEEKGLLHPQRLDNHYRVYGIDALSRVEAIINLKQSGLSLLEIQTIFESKVDFSAMMEKQKQSLIKQIEALQKSIQFIEEQLLIWHELERHGFEKLWIEEKEMEDYLLVQDLRHQKPKLLVIKNNDNILTTYDYKTLELVGLSQKTSHSHQTLLATCFFHEQNDTLSLYIEQFKNFIKAQNYRGTSFIYIDGFNMQEGQSILRFRLEVEKKQ